MAEPDCIHPERLNAQGTVFKGTLRPGDLETLAEDLAGPEGELRYVVTGRVEGERRRVVTCIIEGFVFLTCTSTQEAFRHEVSISDRLVLVDSEAELPPLEDESDQEDYVVAGAPLDVRDMVEEAVILSLPMVPRKPGTEPAPPVGAAKPEKPSPFAALAGLKRPK